MADNNTWGRISTMKGGGVQGFYEEAKKAIGDKWQGTKDALATLKDATGLGVSDEVASAARQKIGQGIVDSAKGMAALAGPTHEEVQAAYMSGNQDAIDAVSAAQQAQMQATNAIKDSVQKAVTDSYGRNGVMGVLGMATASIGAEVIGQKGTGLATHAAADAVGAAAEAAKVAKLGKAVVKDEGLFVKKKEPKNRISAESKTLDWSRVNARGENAVDHVNLHGADNPGKPMHGVFNGDPIETTNTAWEQAQSSGINPTVQPNGNLVYDVPMGQPVGWQGGSNGTGVALSSVRIVTTPAGQVVTSFPR